jgi:hypothetical protein
LQALQIVYHKCEYKKNPALGSAKVDSLKGAHVMGKNNYKDEGTMTMNQRCLIKKFPGNFN